jgi:hypothetical protein
VQEYSMGEEEGRINKEEGKRKKEKVKVVRVER